MRILKFVVILSFLAAEETSAADGWQAFMSVTDDYFEGTGDTPRIVLQLSNSFHTCGWNNAATINRSAVGDAAFKNLSAVILTAIATGRKVSVHVSGCSDDRANVLAIRLQN